MSQSLSIQELLADPASPWQIHNCKLSQQMAQFDAPVSFLTHYDGLDDQSKAQYPVTFAQIKNTQHLMTASDFAQMIGIDAAKIRRAWQIKYIGSVVIACQPMKIALRLHFSNTSKATQTVYADNERCAWQQESENWRVFGVVDVLYKGDGRLLSVAYDEMIIAQKPHYQALPSEHSLVILNLINEYKEKFDYINAAVIQSVLSQTILNQTT